MDTNSKKTKRAACGFFTAALMCATCLFSGASVLVGASATDDGENVDVKISNLEVNGSETPLGIDDEKPVFSWVLSSDERGKSQSAYQVVVKNGGDVVWNSGKVESDLNYGVVYGGESLQSKTLYDYTVTVWDETGAQCAESTSHFETGLMSTDDWQADWIGEPSLQSAMNFGGANWIWDRSGHADNAIPAETMYFRRSVTVPAGKTVSRVQIAMSADDNAALYINGVAVLATPTVTDAWESATVATIDGSEFSVGDNVVAVSATNTSDGYAGLLAKIEIYYTDGTAQTVATDASWKISAEAPDGWNTLAFDDSGWKTPSGGDIVSYGSAPWGDRVSFASSERAATLLRKKFAVDGSKTVESARAYIAGLGLFELEINGQNPTDSVLNPANTDYDDTVLYNVFDVTDCIRSGDNAVCVELGNGFFNEAMGGWNWSVATWRATPRMRFELDIHYIDGTSERVYSDSSWKFSKDGPITDNSMYCGETIDARKAAEFSSVEYDDATWQNSSVVSAPKGKLVWQDMEPMRKTESFGKADGVAVEYNSNIKKYTVSVPRMITGWGKIAFRNTRAGDRIVIDYGETLASDGNLNKKEQDGIFQRDIYICKGVSGDDVEIYEPKFNYKGFCYIQIDGYGGELDASDVTCYLIHNDVAITSTFDSSSELVNELHSLMVNTLLNNFQGKPTDTPWLEKNGWLGDVNMAIGTMGFDFDIARFMTKFLNDIKDGQLADGSIPQLVPISGWGETNAPVWNSVYIFAVEELCDIYGMNWLVAKYYDSMKKLADRDISVLKGRQWIWGEESVLGDWVSPMGNENAPYDENPPEGGSLAATAYVYKMLGTMIEYATALGGKDADIAAFTEARENILAAFNDKFLSNGVYDTGWWASGHAYDRTRYRQTSNLIPLAFDMVPNGEKQKVVDNLVADIVAKGYHLDTGIIGTKYILPVLCDNGHEDIAYRILTQTTYPSWGYFVESGATSLWEMWESTARSHDHYFLGTYDEWLFSYLGGIKNVENGYRTFDIDPLIAGDLTDTSVKLDTVRGALEVSWQLVAGDKAKFDIVVPFGSTATLYLPTAVAAAVTLDDSELSTTASGVKAVETSTDGRVKVTLGGGKYMFVSSLDKRTAYKGALAQAIESAQKLESIDYREEGWTAFAAELDRAQAVLADSAATQAQINDAATNLTAAAATLGGFANVNRIALKARVNEIIASGVMDLSFTSGATRTFTAVLSQASKAARNAELDEAALKTELDTFEAAIETLLHACKSNFARLGATSVTASSAVNAENDGWGLAKLTDGTTGGANGWSSADLTSQQHEEWVLVDMGFDFAIDKVVIYTRGGSGSTLAYGMPLDFVIEVSTDGERFTPVVTETNYAPTAVGAHTFTFDTVRARYVRVRGTKLNRLPYDGNTYRMQFAELEIYNSPRADLGAIEPLMTRYDALDRSLYTTDSLNALDELAVKLLGYCDRVVYADEQAEIDKTVSDFEAAFDALALKNPPALPDKPTPDDPGADRPSDDDGSTANVGAIVGGTLGGIAVVAAGAAAAVILTKRKKTKSSGEQSGDKTEDVPDSDPSDD